jgi:hypothetical protein
VTAQAPVVAAAMAEVNFCMVEASMCALGTSDLRRA